MRVSPGHRVFLMQPASTEGVRHCLAPNRAKQVSAYLSRGESQIVFQECDKECYGNYGTVFSTFKTVPWPCSLFLIAFSIEVICEELEILGGSCTYKSSREVLGAHPLQKVTADIITDPVV